jgi:Ni,Fe-hydrogenase I cytochrome b subunit
MRSNLTAFTWFALVAISTLLVAGYYTSLAASEHLTAQQNLAAEYHATMWFAAFVVSSGFAVMLLARIAHEWLHDHVLHRSQAARRRATQPQELADHPF